MNEAKRATLRRRLVDAAQRIEQARRECHVAAEHRVREEKTATAPSDPPVKPSLQQRYADARAGRQPREPWMASWDTHSAAGERLRAAQRAFRDLLPERWLPRLAQGDPDITDVTLTYLEADPWCFRSGYTKGVILPWLPRLAPFTPADQARLAAILVHLVEVGDRNEFHWTSRVAPLADPQRLRDGLATHLHGRDIGRRRRAFWLTTRISDFAWSPDMQALAADVLIEGGLSAPGRYQARWRGWLARHVDAASLRDRALEQLLSPNDRLVDAAACVLRLVGPAQLTPEHRARVEQRLLMDDENRQTRPLCIALSGIGPTESFLAELRLRAATRNLRGYSANWILSLLNDAAVSS